VPLTVLVPPVGLRVLAVCDLAGRIPAALDPAGVLFPWPEDGVTPAAGGEGVLAEAHRQRARADRLSRRAAEAVSAGRCERARSRVARAAARRTRSRPAVRRVLAGGA
jgi:hypothetical protein